MLPDMPPLSHMRNYGLPLKEQKFRTEVLPVNFKLLKEGSRDKEAVIEEMYHLRDNGEWWIIKNTSVYVSGAAWFYFNCWTLQEGYRPHFRMESVEFYQVLEWVIRTPSILGMLLVKARQEGATAKINCFVYNYASRYREANCGLMGDDEKRAKSNLAKITKGHNKMPYYFKPRSKGTTKTLTQLSFTQPPQTISLKNIEEVQSTDYDGLESDITFKVGLGAYDGDRLALLYFDEVFKVKQFDVNEQLAILRPAFESVIRLAEFSGKIIYASTVEDKKKATDDESESLKVTAEMWEQSNIKDVDSYGRTQTGLVRYFRDSLNKAPVDEWGFHIKEPFLALIHETRKRLVDAKNWTALSAYKRKMPLDIEDALQAAAAGCPLFPESIEQKLAEIRAQKQTDRLAVQGNLVFVDETWHTVRWIPDPGGRWWISQHPDEANAKMIRNNRAVPKNSHLYKGALDPTDSTDTVSRDKDLSKTGMTVKRSLDKSVEDLEAVGFYEEQGMLKCRNPRALKTNRIVCTYLHRNEDPDDIVRDALATAIYYGFKILVESNTPYVQRTIKKMKPEYLASTPREVRSELSIKQKRAKEFGVRMDARNKTTMTDSLVSYFHDYWQIIEHVNLLENARKFNGKNHSKCDLVVSTMETEVQDQVSKFVQEEKENNQYWSHKLLV